MSSQPTGAEVWINGTRLGVTPVSLDLDNQKNHTVIFRREGFQEVTCQLTTSVGSTWVILDVVLAITLVPLIVDAATGKWKSLDQDACNVNLPPASGTDWFEDKKTSGRGYADSGSP